MQYRFTVTFKAQTKGVAEEYFKAMITMLGGDDAECKIGALQIVPAEERVIIHTDGGCDRNRGGLGAWAFAIRHPDATGSTGSEALQNTTNNRMEMLAVIKALDEIEIGTPVTVFSDSEYVVKGLTVWARQWMKNGWRTRAGQPVKNRDLWEQLVAIYQLHDVRLVHVPGHSGDAGNELVDTMCTEAMNAASRLILAGGEVEIDEFGDVA